MNKLGENTKTVPENIPAEEAIEEFEDKNEIKEIGDIMEKMTEGPDTEKLKNFLDSLSEWDNRARIKLPEGSLDKLKEIMGDQSFLTKFQELGKIVENLEVGYKTYK